VVAADAAQAAPFMLGTLPIEMALGGIRVRCNCTCANFWPVTQNGFTIVNPVQENRFATVEFLDQIRLL